jgi:hypothetical protein
MTKSEIRDEVMLRDGVEKVTIKRDGSIIAQGYMPRGDGGPTPWSMYVGDITDLEWSR